MKTPILGLLFVANVFCNPVPFTYLEDAHLDMDKLRYQLGFKLNKDFNETLDFIGESHINFVPLNEKQNLVLHNQNNLSYADIRATADNTEITIDITPNKETQTTLLKFSQTLESGKEYKLIFKYTGKINKDKTQGLYMSTYKEGSADE